MTEQPAPDTRKPKISRRGFLIALGVGGAGLAVGVTVGVPFGRLKLAGYLDSASMPSMLKAEATAWFEILPDNTVIIYIPKIEMGQGIHTALAQVAAEELEADWDQVVVKQARTGQGIDDSAGTSGSSSVSSMYTPMREAAATMREMLRIEAARLLNVAVDDVTAEKSTITSSSGEMLTYGEIVDQVDEWELLDETPPLKAASTFKQIGQPYGRVDMLDKVTGKAQFGYDVRLDGMLYGAVARPDTLGATLLSAAPGEAESMPGVVAVVIEDGFAGVAAQTREQAYAALEAMELQWSEGERWSNADIEAAITVGQGKGVVIQKVGNADKAFDGQGPVTAEYRTPLAFHAQLEPQAAIADVQPDSVDAWVSIQSPMSARNAIAEMLNRDKESVTVHPSYVGGGFGRKIDSEPAVDAARLSHAAGQPVKVAWNRSEEFNNGFLRPPTHHILTGLLDDAGHITAMRHEQASGEVSFPFLPPVAGTIMGADFGSWRGAFINYDVEHRKTIAWLNDLPVPTGWWRGLGLMANVFATESFMDELAIEARADPLQFRLDHVPADENRSRYRTVLQTLRDTSGWGKSLPEGSGRGVAISIDVNTIVGEVVELSVEGGEITVHRVTAVVDPGLIINPDGVIAQTQGAITMGISAALLEEALIEDGQYNASNYDQYPLLRFGQAPDIDVTLLESGDSPYGMGEPPIGPIGAALANAIYAATGQRLRRLPLRVE